MMNKVMIGLPSYDGRTLQETLIAIMQRGNVQATVMRVDCSSLTRSFNTLWAMALEGRGEFTHFCMLHDDVSPEAGWLEKMLSIMAEKKADVLSVVIPQKTMKGYTSTALDCRMFKGAPDDHWQVKALTLREIYEREETFTDPALLVNTGLMLVDLSKPWVEEVYFRFEPAILKTADGKFKVYEISEDWFFSREAKERGAVLYATRAVKVNHYGRAAYTNAAVWGAV